MEGKEEEVEMTKGGKNCHGLGLGDNEWVQAGVLI